MIRLATFLLVLLPTLLLAQPELVVDFALGDEDSFNDWYKDVGLLGDKIFMSIETPETGPELGMISNGTLTMLKEFIPGSDGGEPMNFTNYKGKLYFTLDNHELTPQIWVTEGTEQSTKKFFEATEGYGFGAFQVTKNDMLFFTNDYKLYQFDGTEVKMIDDQRSPEEHWGNLHASHGFNTYNDGFVFLDYEDGKTHLFYTEGETVASLGSINGGTSVGDYYGLSQTKGGIVFGVSDFFGAPTGHYFWDEQTQEIEYMQVNGEKWNVIRHMELTEEKDVVWDQDGFHVLEGNQHEFLTDMTPTYASQGVKVVSATYDGKMVFCTNTGGFGSDEAVFYTDGTTEGTSLLFQIDHDTPQNMILDGNMAYVTFGYFSPQFWQINMDTKEYKNIYTTPEFTGDGAAHLVGIQGEYLYYFSDVDQTLGKELYRLKIGTTSNVKDQLNTLAADIIMYSDGFEVLMDEQQAIQVDLFDQLGRRVRRIETQSNQRAVVPGLSGVYHLQVTARAGARSLTHYFGE